MAISYVKKNKNMISRWVKLLTSNNTFRRSSYVTLNDFHGKKVHLYGTLIHKRSKIKVVEEKDKVYIGLDLDFADNGRLSYVDRDNACDLVIEAMYDYLGDANNPEIEAIWKREGILPGNDYNTIRNNKNIIVNSSVVTEMYDILMDVQTSGIKMTLRDGEWPRLKDRSILPIMIIDKESNQIDYYNKGYSSPSSYREGREKVDVSRFDKSNMTQILRRVPYDFIKITYNSKYVKND